MVLLGVALSAARRDRAGKALKNSPPLGAKKDAPEAPLNSCRTVSQGAFSGHKPFLLPDNGNWAVGVTDHGVRNTAHKRPPYSALAPAAHHYHPGSYFLS
jgi:hypothetical protein